MLPLNTQFHTGGPVAAPCGAAGDPRSTQLLSGGCHTFSLEFCPPRCCSIGSFLPQYFPRLRAPVTDSKQKTTKKAPSWSYLLVTYLKCSFLLLWCVLQCCWLESPGNCCWNDNECTTWPLACLTGVSQRHGLFFIASFRLPFSPPLVMYYSHFWSPCFTLWLQAELLFEVIPLNHRMPLSFDNLSVCFSGKLGF